LPPVGLDSSAGGCSIEALRRIRGRACRPAIPVLFGWDWRKIKAGRAGSATGDILP